MRPTVIASVLVLLSAFTLLAAAPVRVTDGDNKDTRVFELRTYYAAPGKLDALHARFRDHTCKLFEKHGMTNIGYWVPVANPDNKLIYIIAFPSQEAHAKAWKEFIADPEWQKAYKESEVSGKLVEKIESVLLSATDYSPEL